MNVHKYRLLTLLDECCLYAGLIQSGVGFGILNTVTVPFSSPAANM